MNKKDILLVDDDPAMIQTMAAILASAGQLRFATNGEDALKMARQALPDLVLLDAEMPGINGFQVLEALKADPTLAIVPVIFVTSHCESTFEVAGLDLGAADFIAKPVSAPQVLARVRAQLRAKQVADDIRQIVSTDSLTGVANRRQFEATLEREWLRARRANEPLSLLTIAADHFTAYNERYGQRQGDACLLRIAQLLQGAVQRPGDLVARYCAEQFMVLLPQTAGAGAQHVAQRVLTAVESLAILHEASPTAGHVTVSVGIAVHEHVGSTAPAPAVELRGCVASPSLLGPAVLVTTAQRALKAARMAGRAQESLLLYGS